MRRHSPNRVGAAAAAAILALSLAACTEPPPDPEQTIESLTSVTEAPEPPTAADEYDALSNPDPVVDPLDCTPYLVLTARGTGEPSKGQLLSPVAKAISSARPEQVATHDLDYPADVDVNEGGTIGARYLIDTINVQHASCPEQRFVLLGYSQGALIVGDALIEPEHRLVGSTVGRIDDEALERVLAVVLYGDPRFVAGEPFNTGTFDAELSGLLPRPLGSLDALADRVRDYCVAKDFICQSSLDLDESGHIEYYSNGMQQDGAAFVITRLGPIARPEAADSAQSPEAPEPPTAAEGS